MTIDEINIDLYTAARKMAGNWRGFEDFSWLRRYDVPDADDWAVVYTHSDASGLLVESNAAWVRKAMARFAKGDDPDVVFESHDHWLVGRIHGFSIRVYRDDDVTDAFEAWRDVERTLRERLVPDEEDYESRELTATLRNIEEAAAVGDIDDDDLPADWPCRVYRWFLKNDPSAVADDDGRGGWPSTAQIKAALDGLNRSGVMPCSE